MNRFWQLAIPLLCRMTYLIIIRYRLVSIGQNEMRCGTWSETHAHGIKQ